MDAHSMHFGLRIQTNTSILDLDGENRERTRLLLSQFSLRDQASNWHEHIPAGSITTWEDLTTRFLAQFFPPGRNAKLRNDFLMFQQHQGELNKLTSSCEIYNGPQNTQYCMENPEQAFVEYASSRADKAGERGFLSQKGGGGRRGVKEKNGVAPSIKENNGVSTKSDDTMNEDTLVGVASVVLEGVIPSMVDMTVETEKLSSLNDTTVMGSFPPLYMLGTTMAGNAPGKSLYANITGKPSRKKVNAHTLFTHGGNGIDVVVLVDSIRVISERFANTAYGSSTGLLSFQFSSIDGLDAMLENGPWFIRNNQLILKKWHLDENLLKEDVSTVLRVGEKNTVKKPSQTSQGVVPTIKVSNSNPFKVLYSFDNYVELGTNGGTTNLVNNKATSSGSSFLNVNNSNTRTTPIIDKIKKFEELLTSGKATLVDKAGNPLKKVEYSDDYDSGDEVASVNNDMARSIASERVGFGTQSLLEQ
ncbi:retrovirus-related pol polyprotein from transposon TNT 1-94 [Tanacetum coccineum]